MEKEDVSYNLTLRANWLIHFSLTLKIATEDWQTNERFQSDVVPEANTELSASDNSSICVSTTEKIRMSVLGHIQGKKNPEKFSCHYSEMLGLNTFANERNRFQILKWQNTTLH